jgi:O-antigen ligase
MATVLFVSGIVGLFLFNRDKKARTSKALWLPVIWLLITGSRSVSQWLQMGPVSSADAYLEGSPLDRNIYAGLVALGILVLISRRARVMRLLKTNAPILIFLAYCLLSIAWSDFPDVAFKRWIKFVGDHVMVMIVLTDLDRLRAIKQVFARVSFLLLPLSILFIKYYPDLGRGYSRWEGKVSYTGVSTDKNMLGMACLIFGLASLWCLLQELRERGLSLRNLPMIAHAVVVGMTLWLLLLVNSMTSLSCFLLAGSVMVATSLGKTARRPGRVHVMVVTVLVISFAVLFLNLGSFLLSAMGRDPSLTGRTDIWATALRLAPNPILGAGFESFWLGKRLEAIWEIYWFHPIESHNGYIETYLNLGWAGVVLLAFVMLTGYRNVVTLLQRDPEAGRLRLAYFIVGVAYNFTEAAIHTMSLVWIAFILSIIALPEPAAAKSPVSKARAEVVEVSSLKVQEVV